MTVIEKVDYLIKHLDLNEKQFAKKFRIRKNVISKWRAGALSPKPENIKYLCEKFGFELNDFLDDNSTLDFKDSNKNKHVILGIKKVHNESAVSEDYPHEDNSRYEEKD